MNPLRIGIGGPVGSGKSHLLLRLCEHLRGTRSIIAVTNDIYTVEDAKFLNRRHALETGRILGVETGGCPHAAVRDDISLNVSAIEELYEKFPDADLVFIESGGDNLSATFSPDLVDFQIYVIDVAQGGDIPRKGGLGIAHSDLLVVNKIDLAPYVGVDLERMRFDVEKARGEGVTHFTNLRTGEGARAIASWVDSLAEGEKGRSATTLAPLNRVEGVGHSHGHTHPHVGAHVPGPVPRYDLNHSHHHRDSDQQESGQRESDHNSSNP